MKSATRNSATAYSFACLASERWRIAAMYEDDADASEPTEQFWYHNAGASGLGGSSYIDAVVLRDRDTDANGTLDERRYYLQNQHHDVVALINTSGSISERVNYDPYGSPIGTFTGVANRKGYAGYEYDAELGDTYHVRHRVYRSDLGVWTRRDPLGYVDGLSLYEYAGAAPTSSMDSHGTTLHVFGFEGYRVSGFTKFVERDWKPIVEASPWNVVRKFHSVSAFAADQVSLKIRELVNQTEPCREGVPPFKIIPNTTCYHRFALLGYSLGGEGAARAARNLRNSRPFICVDLLFTSDPVKSAANKKCNGKLDVLCPWNVGSQINFYQLSDTATFGGVTGCQVIREDRQGGQAPGNNTLIDAAAFGDPSRAHLEMTKLGMITGALRLALEQIPFQGITSAVCPDIR